MGGATVDRTPSWNMHALNSTKLSPSLPCLYKPLSCSSFSSQTQKSSAFEANSFIILTSCSVCISLSLFKLLNMGVIRFEKEAPAAVAPSRMFKAFVDSHNLLPKIVPQAFKSIDILQGDGGVGTVKLLKFAGGK